MSRPKKETRAKRTATQRAMQSDFEPSEVLSGALQGDRTDALCFWRKVAQGAIDTETRLFIESVAARVLDADKTKGRPRAEGLMTALFLAGREDRNRTLLRWHQLKHEFDDFEVEVDETDSADARPNLGETIPLVSLADVDDANALMSAGKLPFVADPGKILRNEYAKLAKQKKNRKEKKV